MFSIGRAYMIIALLLQYCQCNVAWMFSKCRHSIDLILQNISYTSPYKPDHMWIATEFYIKIECVVVVFAAIVFILCRLLSVNSFFPLKRFFFSHFVPFDFGKSHKQTVLHENCSKHAHKICIYEYLFSNMFVGFPRFIRFLFTRWLCWMKIDYFFFFEKKCCTVTK